MSFPERPPLHPIVCEQIDVLLHKVDERHWPQIAAMRVKNYYPLDTPVPPQAPEHLRNQIHWYATDLFKTEADQYEQFRSDVRYGGWLSNLSDRTRERVMKALDRLESSDPLAKMIGVTGSRGLILGYHGLTTQGVEEELRIMLLELRGQYERGTAPGQTSAADVLPPPQVQAESPKLSEPSRESLAEQIKRLKDECDITAEEIAEALGVVPRSIFKHLSGKAVPRRGHLVAYERLFTDRLGRSVTLQKVKKRSQKGHSKGT
jgi:DNA-binding transcriptional ArsR family regulator